MRLEDVKVGMKVKLLGKHSAGDNYDNIEEWYRDCGEFKDVRNIQHQGYGIVKEIINKYAIIITDKDSRYGVWTFMDSDLESYEKKQSLFKIGDRVRVKDIEVGTLGEYGGNFVSDTRDFVGKEYVIRMIRFQNGAYGYTLENGDIEWIFAEEWLELVEEHTKTPKEWLLTRFVIATTRDGDKFIVINNEHAPVLEDSGRDNFSFNLECDFDEDLKDVDSYPPNDIVKLEYNGEVVWEREEVKEMTLAEAQEILETMLDIKVKIVD